uniref:Uncharacterized protein n=1 Tax=Klebsiella pneumoniae TaxID=573 RepID=A0A8B0STR3_KLEPN|nr:hypothetical protein [Klebsiella pneumoniae]
MIHDPATLHPNTPQEKNFRFRTEHLPYRRKRIFYGMIMLTIEG